MKNQDRSNKEEELIRDEEIDLVEAATILWRNRILIIKTTIIFSFLGLCVAFFSEKEFEASAVMVPQMENQSSRLGGLSSLASLAGFNMDMNTGSDVISPMLYPMIISSTNFQLEVMNAEYQFEGIEEPMSLIDYYENVYKPGLFGLIKKYTIGLPGLIKLTIQGKQNENVVESNTDIFKPSRKQYELAEIIQEQISLDVNEQEGYITLSMSSNQAYLSAQVVQKCQELLQKYVTQFKVEKAVAQLEFIKERYEENKEEFEIAQARLAAFRDANKNISSEIMRTREEKLQNEFQLAFDVYSELAKQLEEARIKVEEHTPVFSVIKEVVIPLEKSKPRRALILFISIIIGGVAGIAIVIGRIYFNKQMSKGGHKFSEENLLNPDME